MSERLIHEPVDAGGGRGLLRSSFQDLDGNSCSIQDSSLATADAIWLGCNTGVHHRGECLARMHLNRQLALELARLLVRFYLSGSLEQPLDGDPWEEEFAALLSARTEVQS